MNYIKCIKIIFYFLFRDAKPQSQLMDPLQPKMISSTWTMDAYQWKHISAQNLSTNYPRLNRSRRCEGWYGFLFQTWKKDRNYCSLKTWTRTIQSSIRQWGLYICPWTVQMCSCTHFRSQKTVVLRDIDQGVYFQVFEDVRVYGLLEISHIELALQDLHWIRLQALQLLQHYKIDTF